MLRSCVVSCWLLAALAWNPGPARAQEGLIFAGGFFDTLYAAVDMEYLGVNDVRLRDSIVHRQLTALVIPDLQADKPFVLKCERRSTRLVKVALAKEDVDLLRGFATDGIYVALQGVRAAPQDAKRVAELQRGVKNLPEEQRVRAERFIGSQLASQELPKGHQLNIYVQSYRDHIERRADDTLKHPETSKDFKDGVPHTFGTQTIRHVDLSQAKDIQIVTIGSRTYQRAWVEGALVVVPLPAKSSATTSDAGKKLQLAPEVKNQVKPSSPVIHIQPKKR